MKIDKYVKEKLNDNIDLKYKDFTKKLCDTKYKILGIRLPKLRIIAKDISISSDFSLKDKLKFMKVKTSDKFEEVMLKGFLIEYIKDIDFDSRLKLLEEYIPYVDNWSICDSVIATLKFIKKDKEKVWKFLDKYFDSKEEFYKRVAIVISMDYFVTDEYIDLVLKKYKEVKLSGYYDKMALAWSLSKIYVYYKEKTLEFLNLNSLDNFTYNKAIQKMIESYRIDEMEKIYLKSLKNKG